MRRARRPATALLGPLLAIALLQGCGGAAHDAKAQGSGVVGAESGGEDKGVYTLNTRLFSLEAKMTELLTAVRAANEAHDRENNAAIEFNQCWDKCSNTEWPPNEYKDAKGNDQVIMPYNKTPAAKCYQKCELIKPATAINGC